MWRHNRLPLISMGRRRTFIVTKTKQEMTYPGTDLKFRITEVSKELNLERDEWSILVVDPYSRRRTDHAAS